MATLSQTNGLNQNLSQGTNERGMGTVIVEPRFAKIVDTVLKIYRWVRPVKVEATSDGENNLQNNESVFYPTTVHNMSVKGLQRMDSEAKFRNIFLFVIDPTSSLYLYWLAIVALAVFYNTLAIVAFVFDDIHLYCFYVWLGCNIGADVVFVIDIFIQARKAYLVNGEFERDVRKIAKRYFKSIRFMVDVLAVLPADIFLLVDHRLSLLRLNRLLKCFRAWDFAERALMRTQFPNSFKISVLIVICIILFHWNACAYFYISLITDKDVNDPDRNVWTFTYTKNADPVLPNCKIPGDAGADSCWFDETGRDVMNREDYIDELVQYWSPRSHNTKFSNFSKEYSLSFYWSSLTLTTKGQQPYPTDSEQNWLEVIDTLIGLLIFAVIVGSVGGIVLLMNQKQSDFQQLLDGIKYYMTYRNVTPEIQKRVINCCEYVRDHGIMQQNEREILETLPERLQGELGVQLHMETLKRVELLKDCEPGLLYELLLRLHYHLFSPGDFLCRRGEVAREMYIIERGRLNYVSDDGKEVYKVLREGDVFGQLAILNLSGDKNGNRREVAICSGAYTDVYTLCQDDVAEVLQEYPEERKRLIKKGIELLRIDHLYDAAIADPVMDEWKMLSKDEQLLRVRDFLDKIDQQITELYEEFDLSSMIMKQRLTRIEDILKGQDTDEVFEFEENDSICK